MMKLRQRAKFDTFDYMETSSEETYQTSTTSEDDFTSPVNSSSGAEEDDCIVLTPPEEQPSVVVDVSKKLTKPTPVAIVINEQPELKRAPYRTIRNMDAIYEFLCDRVKNQPALVTIAAALSAAINRSLMGDVLKINKIDALTLAGTSGCGKTETVLAIKHFLGMDRGYEHFGQFEFIDGSTMSEPMQINNICGAPTGTKGYDDTHTIAHRLNRAINKPVEKKPPYVRKRMPGSKEKIPSIKAPVATPLLPTYVPPPFIMLFIDEIHMVSPEFMMAINGLIDTAEYATPNGKAHFIKPPETTFFIIFTCNYGARAISSLLHRNDALACKYIDEHMRDEGVPTNTIGRLGTICPYYPLEDAALRLLLATRIHDHVQKTPLATTFGKNKRILILEEATRVIVEHVLKQVNADLGVRGAIKELLQKIDLLAEKAFSILYEQPQQPLFLDDDSDETELTLTGHNFEISLFDAEPTEYDDPLIALIKKNPANAQGLDLCKAYANELTTLNTMGIRRGDVALCQFIIPINISAINHTDSCNSSDDSDDQLKVMQEKLDRIAKLVRNTTSDNRRTTIERIKRMMNADDEEDVVVEEKKMRRKKRKQPVKEDEKPIKKPRIELESSTNNHMVSLCCEYNLHTKQHVYKCTGCKTVIDIRNTDVHMCL